MIRIFQRWSVLTLLALMVFSFFLSDIFPAPEIEVASPFAKPYWLDSTLPPTMELSVSASSPEATVEWEWEAPAKISGGGECTELLWRTPSKTISLFKSKVQIKGGEGAGENGGKVPGKSSILIRATSLLNAIWAYPLLRTRRKHCSPQREVMGLCCPAAATLKCA